VTLQSREQNKKFIADGTSINKKANVGTFYVDKKSNSKSFHGTREHSTRQFDSQAFRGSRGTFQTPSGQTSVTSRAVYSTQVAPGVREDAQSRKKATSRSYVENRPFLDQGKSQKSLNQHNAPLTIDQVRELLNKNK
jgi:hypothetical protein